MKDCIELPLPSTKPRSPYVKPPVHPMQGGLPGARHYEDVLHRALSGYRLRLATGLQHPTHWHLQDASASTGELQRSQLPSNLREHDTF
jgi:hypothetical protein